MESNKVRFADLNIGDFFTADEGSAVVYQVRSDEKMKSLKWGYNTRTGEMEYIFGYVVPVPPMSEDEIKKAQADHQRWGKMWETHDKKLKDELR